MRTAGPQRGDAIQDPKRTAQMDFFFGKWNIRRKINK